MSDLSYLETISNKELHAKCLEYGLPNIPVTDSSRKVILRRLQSSILGVPSKNAAAATKKTPSRKTMHSSKATPAAVMNTSVPCVAGKSPSRNNNNSRHTIGVTPREYYPLDSSPVRTVQTTTTVSDVGSQSEDDDFYQVNSPSFKPKKRDDPRLRRSVSLTKSGVLTTSYTREVEKPHYEEEEQPQSYTYQRPQVAQAPTRTLPIYEPRIERSYRPDLSRQSLTQTQLSSTSYLEASNEYNEPIMQQTPRNTFSGSAAPFNLGGATTSAVRQRQTIGDSGFARGRLLQPTYKVNSLYPQLNDFYDQHNNTAQPMDLDTDSESEAEIQQRRQHQRSPGDSTDSPYLSHFSRQLDTRKRSSPLARPQMRSTIQQEDPNAPMNQFRTLITSLDRQYHLKFYFFLMLAVMLATLIYVIVTPAV
ncbi:LEM domain-containing protein Bocksbeutel [Drosophila novamexicana]|uniref:LEM domain-containing protein Bocksbeutel n=1 Tax=Drosophila novamexicana TaxID=47314 RepID=UPI0011E5B5C6|nr:LEM domain-containing protein Bocksbeutel [Drosophila novamexicana]